MSNISSLTVSLKDRAYTKREIEEHVRQATEQFSKTIAEFRHACQQVLEAKAIKSTGNGISIQCPFCGSDPFVSGKPLVSDANEVLVSYSCSKSDSHRFGIIAHGGKITVHEIE